MFLVNKTNRCTEFHFYWYYYSTCFGQPFCPSSAVLSRTSAWYISCSCDRLLPGVGWDCLPWISQCIHLTQVIFRVILQHLRINFEVSAVMEINIPPFILAGEFQGLGDHSTSAFRNNSPRSILIEPHSTWQKTYEILEGVNRSKVPTYLDTTAI